MIIAGAGAVIKYCVIAKAIFILTGTTPVVQNCVIYETPIDAQTTCTIQNTIGSNALLPGIDITITAAKTVTGQYNSFVDPAKSGSGTYTDTGTLWSSNPKFLNASAYDFRLLLNSPCRSKGVNVSLTLDYAGNCVPAWTGKLPDIGAYEMRPTGAVIW